MLLLCAVKAASLQPAIPAVPLAAEPAGEPRSTTLLALVRAVGEVTADDCEVVATILHMLRSGEVKLCGNFRNAPLKDFE
jgi:hypothetical protein